MNLHDNGDIIRGLGFVALNAAYLEEAIDECLEHFIVRKLCDEKYRRYQSSDKIKQLRKVLLRQNRQLSEELEFLPCYLDDVRELLEDRNKIIHGRIYGDPALGIIRRSGRFGTMDTPATSSELISLANNLSNAHVTLVNCSTFGLPRFLDFTVVGHAGN